MRKIADIHVTGSVRATGGALHVASDLAQIKDLQEGATFFLRGNDGSIVNYIGTPEQGVFSEIENDTTETTTVRASNGINTFVFRATAIEEVSLPLGIGNPFENVDDQFAFEGRPEQANVVINEFEQIVGALPIGISFRGRYVGQYFRVCNFTAAYTDGTTEEFTSTVTSHQSRHDFQFNTNGTRILEEIRLNLQDPADPQNPGIVHFQMHFPEIVDPDGLYLVNEGVQSYTPLLLA